jgi:hypothetical protein
MNKTLRWTAVFALLSIVVVVLLLSHVPSQEPPPCHACLSASGEVPQASVCDLVNHRQQVGSKVVRVNGTFRNDASQLYLRDGGCSVAVGITEPKLGCGGTWRKLQMVSGLGTWYDGDAAVTMTGSMSRIAEPNWFASEDGFTILCLEQVRTGPTLREKINFSIHRLF